MILIILSQSSPSGSTTSHAVSKAVGEFVDNNIVGEISVSLWASEGPEVHIASTGLTTLGTVAQIGLMNIRFTWTYSAGV